jgi:hypothetical protein
MKKFYLSAILLFTISALHSQEWEAIYEYVLEDLVWDQPRVDVSSDDIIVVSFETIRSNRAMERSTDGGESWVTINSNFQRGFVGFDSNNNMYIVSEKKNQGISSNYTDSLWYSTDLGDTWQALYDIPDFSPDRSNYYIDADNKFYTVGDGIGDDLEQIMAVFSNGEETESIYSPFDVGSSSLRGFIKLTDGNYVASSYNSGVYYSADGFNWVASEGDGDLGAATYTSLAQANNGTLFLAGVSLEQSSDGGENWSGSSLELNFVSRVLKSGNGNLYAVAAFASPQLYESTDNGATWVGIEDDPSFQVRDFDVSDNYLYAVYDDNTLYRREIQGSLSTDLESVQANFKVFPNPSAGDVVIANEAYSGQPWQLSVFNSIGQLIYQENVNRDRVEISEKAINNAGVYSISIQKPNGDMIYQNKFIKVR